MKRWMLVGTLGALAGCVDDVQVAKREDAGTTDALNAPDVQFTVDATDVAPDARPVANACGATGLIFACQVLNDGPFETGSTLLHDNGSRYFFLCGDYRYWVLADRRQDPRTGQTTAAEVEELFQVSQLDRVSGSYQGVPRSSRGTFVWTAPRGSVSCVDGCPSRPDLPTALVADRGTSTLSQRGQDLDGGLRFVVVSGIELPSTRTGQPITTFRWPLATPIAGVAVTVEEAGRGAAVACVALTLRVVGLPLRPTALIRGARRRHQQAQQRDPSVLPGVAHQPPAPPADTQAAWQSGALPMQRSQPSGAQAQHRDPSVLPGMPHAPPVAPRADWQAAAHDRPALTQAVQPEPAGAGAPSG